MSRWRRLPGPLCADTLGDGERIVFCHGFTQTGRSWRPVAETFAGAGWESVVVDLPGHGGSTDVRADPTQAGDLLAGMLGPASFVGYSMGGRMALRLAVDHPGAVRRLVLIGASPGIADETERASRRAHDEALAEHILDVGVHAFLAEWTAQPLFGGTPPGDADLAERAVNSAAGLGGSLRLAGAGSQEPLWDRLAELTMPVLVMAGERDAKFADIGRRLALAVPDGTFSSVPDADHAAHLQQPEVVAAMVLAWARGAAPSRHAGPR